MKDAVREVPDGVILDLEITPGAKETEIYGYNQWRKRIEVRVSERAQKGRANDKLISFFSKLLRINSGNINIVTGLTNSKKSLKVTGLKTHDVLEALTKK